MEEQAVSSPVGLLERVEVGHGLPEDVHDFMNLGAVSAELGIAVGHGVDGLVALEPLSLESEALDELFDLADEDEVEVLFAEVALALGAVDGLVGGGLHQLEDELPLALRALEDFRQHGVVYSRRLC